MGSPPASLKTEQRPRHARGVAVRVRSTFQEGRRHECRRPLLPRLARRNGGRPCELPRKEVIQPQLPLRLPCYDFTPITSPTFDGSLP